MDELGIRRKWIRFTFVYQRNSFLTFLDWVHIERSKFNGSMLIEYLGLQASNDVVVVVVVVSKRK